VQSPSVVGAGVVVGVPVVGDPVVGIAVVGATVPIVGALVGVSTHSR